MRQAVGRYFTNKLKKIYEEVYWCDLLWRDSMSMYQKLKSFNIKNHTKENYKTTAIMSFMGGPHYYPAGSKIPLQVENLRNGLRAAQIYNCDIYLVSFFSVASTYVDFLQGWNNCRFHIVELDIAEFPHTKGIKKHLQRGEPEFERCKYKISHLATTHRTHKAIVAKFLLAGKLERNNLISIRLGFHPANDEELNCGETPNDALFDEMMRNYIIPIQKLENDWSDFDNELQHLWDTQPLKQSIHPSVDNNFVQAKQTFLAEACVNVIAETVFEYPYWCLTEKTFQPMIVQRPFVMIGPYQNLKYLKSKGYKTFDSIWDESYDNIKDPNQRMKAVMELISQINNMSMDDLKNKLHKVKDILAHNLDLTLEKRKGIGKNWFDFS